MNNTERFWFSCVDEDGEWMREVLSSAGVTDIKDRPSDVSGCADMTGIISERTFEIIEPHWMRMVWGPVEG